jgi:hypothetical protein
VIAAGLPHSGARTRNPDALYTYNRTRLSIFTGWLKRFHVRGIIGEIGWPNLQDSGKWNALAEVWFRDADAARLWVTAWVAAESYGPLYKLGIYVSPVPKTAISLSMAQARVIEAHPTTARYRRGVNSSGGEWGYPINEGYSATYNNEIRGVYGVDYQYDSQASFQYLASKGVRLVRIPFRWERVQPALYKPFDPAEFGELRAAVHRARKAGLLPIIDMHNFGGYYMVRGNPLRAPRQDLGSTTLPIKAFVDFWRRMAKAFRNDRSVFGYDLMNEPTSTRNPVPPPSETARPLLGNPKTWERASQAALNAIRAIGDRRVILVGGFGWSGVGYWPKAHARPWIRDRADNFLYEAHQFFDCRVGGQYNSTYDDELQCAKDAGWKP